MLKKEEIKACLSGECPRYVPAWLFWMDGKFREKNRADVEQMQNQYQNDFVFAGVNYRNRHKDRSKEVGEFTDNWGCLFCAASDGVGSHPTRPIVKNIEDWERYVSEEMPEIAPDNHANAVRTAVENHPEYYVVSLGTKWRGFIRDLADVLRTHVHVGRL